jgi:hypothetical protein
VTPLDFVKNSTVLGDQGGVEEESLGKGGLCMMDGFPIGRAEVDAKREAYLEEQVVNEDEQKGTHHIRVMLDLVEARFHVIGMDDNVVVGV